MAGGYKHGCVSYAAVLDPTQAAGTSLPVRQHLMERWRGAHGELWSYPEQARKASAGLRVAPATTHRPNQRRSHFLCASPHRARRDARRQPATGWYPDLLALSVTYYPPPPAPDKATARRSPY